MPFHFLATPAAATPAAGGFPTDLRYMCGKLAILALLTDNLDAVLKRHGALASLAFVDGWRYANGLSMDEPFLEGPPAERPAPGQKWPRPRPMAKYLRGNHGNGTGVCGAPEGDDPPLAENGDADDDEHDAGSADEGEEGPEVAEFLRQMDEVERRTQDATQELRDALYTQMTRDVVKDLVTTWTALGSFTRRWLGVEPDVLYRAWCPIIAEDVAESLARHPDVKPSKAGVREHLETMEGAWKRQIGDTDNAKDNDRTYGG